MELNSENFQHEVLESSVPVLVDFWAEWCGPCRMLKPNIDKLEEQAGDRFKVGKVNVDECGDLAATYKIASIPTLIVFKGGEAVKRVQGLQNMEKLLEIVENA